MHSTPLFLSLWIMLRPKQWAKNAFVVAPIFFAHQWMSLDAWGLTLLAALAFSMVASAVYVVNDLWDLEEDRHHPVKAKRPLAAGEVPSWVGWVMVGGAVPLAAGILALLPEACALVILLYVVGNILYSRFLKHRALLDVFFIGFCFILRVQMGCVALGVVVSPWIVLTTFMLALFLGFGKRYHEIGIEDYATHKRSLQGYSREFLDRLLLIAATASLVCYAIYTVDMARHTGEVGIVYSVVFVAFGLFRYLQSLYVFGQGGAPEHVLLHDRWQWINLCFWLLLTLYSSA